MSFCEKRNSNRECAYTQRCEVCPRWKPHHPGSRSLILPLMGSAPWAQPCAPWVRRICSICLQQLSSARNQQVGRHPVVTSLEGSPCLLILAALTVGCACSQLFRSGLPLSTALRTTPSVRVRGHIVAASISDLLYHEPNITFSHLAATWNLSGACLDLHPATRLPTQCDHACLSPLAHALVVAFTHVVRAIQ